MTNWYLTGVLAALGFSLGLCLLRPGTVGISANRHWLDAVTWMDGRWYKQIATEGYRYDPANRSNVAFFPVYPLLGRGLMAATGLKAEAALLIVSNASLLAALGALALYVRARGVGPAFQAEFVSMPPLGQESLAHAAAPAELADYTVLAAALFPTGCFFRLAYSESTFLLLAVQAMYAMLRRWPLWAIALIVGLATAARPVGVALLVPFAIHIWRRYGRVSLALPCARLSLYLPLACWGIVLFMVYQYNAFGEPFATVKVQDRWRVRKSAPWREKAVALATFEPIRSVYDRESRVFWADQDAHRVPWFSLPFANPLFFVAGAALVALGAWRRWLCLEEASFGVLLLLIPYLTRAYEMAMGSMGRFAAVIFPVHLVLGQLLVRMPAPLRAAVLALSGFLLAAYTALYAAGYVIF